MKKKMNKGALRTFFKVMKYAFKFIFFSIRL